MAKTKVVKSSSKKLNGGTLDGLRRASAVRKQVGRWQERKWPMNPTNAPEWLRFAHALEAEAQVIKAEALALVNPSLLAKSKKELLQERANVATSGVVEE